MYLTISVDKTSPPEERAKIQVTAPFIYKSTGANPGTLYYTRLPGTMSQEDVVNSIVRREWEFVSNSEFNFLAVFVTKNRDEQSWTLVRDRYGSQRVLIRETKDSLIVTTDPWAVRHRETQWNPEGLRHALASRIITEVALEKDVSVLPLSHGLSYDEKGGLALIETGVESLRIQETQERSSDDELIERIKESIFESYKAISPNTPVAVLLSGGVDSFILAAIACRRFSQVKAYTPTWSEGVNPELERAIIFAEYLGIDHNIITIKPEDFNLSFVEMIQANGVPIRNYSSLVLHSLSKHIPEKHILYGEYADTLFGSFPIKSGIMDRKYAQILSFIPGGIVPTKMKSLFSKIKKQTLEQIILIPSITESYIQRHFSSIGVNEHQQNISNRTKIVTRVSAIEFNLRTSCSQHMIEIETTALLQGKKVITPFYNQRMVTLSNRLSNQQMFGPSELRIRKNFKKDTSNQAKPLLKKLACQFIQPEAIYLKKLGFPTPFSKWIQSFIVTNNVNDINIYVEGQNPEQIWSSINFIYLTNKEAPKAGDVQLGHPNSRV